MPKDDQFGEAYYRRFYGTKERVHDALEIGLLVASVVNYAAWLGVRITRVLDVGAGPGYWRDWFKQHRPDVAVRSIDVSAFACEKYGHEQRDISAWRADDKFDLVVCQGVLQYLDDDACVRAIGNLGAMCQSLMYLEAVTSFDLEEVVDRKRTDLAIHGRPGEFYLRHLAPDFRQVGAGLWTARASGPEFYELEAAGR
jgi:SAM-dependent methyltransferase